MEARLFPGSTNRFHFVGIGGIGMSGIARILLQAGYTVSGSDSQESPILDEIRTAGGRIHLGHSESHLGDTQVVVYSTAIAPNSPELKAARSRQLTLLHRSELLAELMRPRFGIAVSGTHGKTTASALIATLLTEGGLDPSAVIGGVVPSLNGSFRFGKGQYFVAEADESDRSFLRLPGTCKVVTNIDDDHMDCYAGREDLIETFSRFLNDLPFYGCAIACAESSLLRAALKNVHRRVVTYGFDEAVCLCAQNLTLGPFYAHYDCVYEGQLLGKVELNMAGRHNALNSLAAVAVGLWLELPFSTIVRTLGSFEGTERRLQWKGEYEGIGVIDDYAHHPTEIEATLEACRVTGRRLIAVFQPHRFSRTEYLMKRMNSCFDSADKLLLMDVYGAGEAPVLGADSKHLAGEIGRHRAIEYLGTRIETVRRLREICRSGDLILTLGAGDVFTVGEEFLGQESKS